MRPEIEPFFMCRLQCKMPENEDVSAIFEIYNDSRTSALGSIPAHHCLDDSVELLERWKKE